VDIAEEKWLYGGGERYKMTTNRGEGKTKTLGRNAKVTRAQNIDQQEHPPS
jgi:hypothetical protein